MKYYSRRERGDLPHSIRISFRNETMAWWTVGSLILMFFVAGCASKPGSETNAAPVAARTDTEWNPSSVSMEISYVRGHNLHRFNAEVRTDQIFAQCFLDRQLLKEHSLNRDKYTDLVKQASDLVKQLEQHPVPKPSLCRTPFTLKLKGDREVKLIDGCRSSDEGAALGKLIKDAEFLVFSQN